MLIRHLEYRMHEQKMSNFIVETGPKGSGKSWLGLRFGEVIEGKEFGIDNVCFASKDLFQRLDKDCYSEGDVVLLEELGISANSRDAMSRANKHLSFIAQAIRPARITLIANSITWGLIDSQVKNMADFKLTVIGHDVQTNLTEFKFMAVSPNDSGAEPFKSHLQFDGIKYVSWEMSRPSRELADIYDEARRKYLKQLYSDGYATLNGKDDIRFGEGKRADIAPKKTAEEIAKIIAILPSHYSLGGHLNPTLISDKLGVSIRRAEVAKGLYLQSQK